MKRFRTYFGFTAALLALALAMAGCGGGGGSASIATSPNNGPSYVNFTSRINFGNSQAMRVAQTVIPSTVDTAETEILYQGCGDLADWISAAEQTTSADAEVPVYVYVTSDAQSLFNTTYAQTYEYNAVVETYGPVASACTVAYRDTSTQRVTLRNTGDFTIDNVEAGTNHLLEAMAYTDTSAMVYVAVVVPYVDEGYYTNGVEASPESTLAAAATIKYAAVNNMGLADVPENIVYAIHEEVEALFPSGFSYGSAVTPTGFTSSVTFSDFSAFSYGYATGTTTWDEYVVSQADLTDLEDPYVIEFTPSNGATDVAATGTVFSVIFNESMDSSVTLSSMSMVFTGSDSTTLSFDETAGDYAWSTTYNTDDTLVLTLSSNATLTSLGFTPFAPGVTYTMSTISLPANLTDLAGNTVDNAALNMLMGGATFTTAAVSITPMVTVFDPAPGATDVWYDAPKFCAVFNQSMNTAISPIGFGLSITNTGTGGTMTIDDTNASAYGSFSWESRTSANDALCFILFSSSTLTANGLKTLSPATHYQITTWTAPAGLMSADGQALDTTNIATVGSSADFTTIP